MTTPHTPHQVGLKDWAALLLLTVLWGSAFAFIKHGVQTLPPGALIFVRLSLAALVLTIWAYARGRRLPPLSDRRWLWMGGLGFFGNALPFFLVSWSQQFIDSALAGILVSTMPLATIALAHVFVPGERMTMRAVLGLIVGFAGVTLLLGPSALAGLGGADTLAQLAIIGAAICYAINAIQARLLPETPPSVSAAGMLIMATIFTLPLGIWDLMQVENVAGSAWAAAAWLAIGPTAFASVILMQVARTAGPNFLAIANYLTPIAALLTGLLIGETIGWTVLLALVVILAGVWLARSGQRID
ncbi:DMT family transporter [uncultured Maricaulis sp.]|uniref:DMT family transporter n=1 Tax=uncultured Maricaulis sp. TaxID=174710 RepID=UPI002601F74B|nr:DMT family transporter [uncultured Maricaulis sp.]